MSAAKLRQHVTPPPPPSLPPTLLVHMAVDILVSKRGIRLFSPARPDLWLPSDTALDGLRPSVHMRARPFFQGGEGGEGGSVKPVRIRRIPPTRRCVPPG